jgi:hypothetical protein
MEGMEAPWSLGSCQRVLIPLHAESLISDCMRIHLSLAASFTRVNSQRQ